MNIAPDINNHLRSIDLFRSMIIHNNRAKGRGDHPPTPLAPFALPPLSEIARSSQNVVKIQPECSQSAVRM